MKSILKSCQPKIVVNVLDKKATVLIAKKFPKDYKGWVYIYCTKRSPWIYWNEGVAKLNNGQGCIYGYKSLRNDNGKVVARFYCDKVDDYLKPNHKRGYAIHISQLEIFDKPKELGEFKTLQRAKATDCGYLKQCKKCGRIFNRCHLLKPLTKAPQSYMFIEVVE